MSLVDQSPAAVTFLSIMVPMDVHEDTKSRAKLAMHLADRFSARVIGTTGQELQTPLYFEDADAGVASIMDIQAEQAKKAMAQAEAAFRDVAGARNRIEWRQAL